MTVIRPGGEKRVQNAIDSQLKAFVKRFGREPREDEPVFFDPDIGGDIPVQMSEQKLADQMVATADEAQIRHELIWVFIRTGYILDDWGFKQLNKKERKRYRNAWREYESGKVDVQAEIAAAKLRLSENKYYDHFIKKETT